MFPIIHCLRKKQSWNCWFIRLLIGDFEVNSKGIKVALIRVSFIFTLKSYKHVVLWSREHFLSQSKFKDDTESLKTEWCYSEDREGECYEPNFYLKFDVFSNSLYLWIGKLKTCIPLSKMIFFLRKSKSKEETIWQ